MPATTATVYEPLNAERDHGPWCSTCNALGCADCCSTDADDLGSWIERTGTRCGCGETIECDSGRMRVTTVNGKVTDRTALCGACATEEQEPPDITPAGVAALHDRITALEAERDAARDALATEQRLTESMLPDVRAAVAERDKARAELDEARALASAQSSRAATLIRELTAERDAARAERDAANREIESTSKRLAALLQRVSDRPAAARRAS